MLVQFRLQSLDGRATVILPKSRAGTQIVVTDPEEVFLLPGTIGCLGYAKRVCGRHCRWEITMMVCPPAGMKRMKVLNKYRDRIATNAVNIMRPSKWGNPFVIGVDGTRQEVIDKYEMWIATQPKLLKSLHELKGRDLVCCCKPLNCHGDVLLRLVGDV